MPPPVFSGFPAGASSKGVPAMSRNHLFCPILVLAAMLLLALSAAADPAPAVKTSTVSVAYQFNPPSQVVSSGETRLHVDDCLVLQRPGEPLMPFRTAKVLLPPGSDVTGVRVRPTMSAKRLRVEQPLAFARTPMPLSSTADALTRAAAADRPLAAIYGSNELYPAQGAQLVSIQRWYGYDIAIVRLFPVQYRPKSGGLLFQPELRLELTITPKVGDADGLAMLGVRDRSVEVAAFVDNPSSLGLYSQAAGERRLGAQPGYDYLLITSEALLSPFQPLIQQKEACGLRVKTADIDDIYAAYNGVDDADELRQYIRDAYLDWGVEYVLLGGDTNIIPFRRCYGYSRGAAASWEEEYESEYIPTELYLGALDGPWNNDGDDIWGEPNDGAGGGDVDLLAEVWIGRAPVQDWDEVENFVDKLVGYETNGHHRHDQALFLGEYLGNYDGNHGQGGDNLDRVAEHFDDFQKTWLDDRPYHWDQWGTEECLDALNDSPHLVAHDGHAWINYCMRLNYWDVASLYNSGLFLATSCGCYSGAFDSGDCIAENMVNREQFGAFAAIMNSRYGWFDPTGDNFFSGEFQRALFQRLLEMGDRNIGKANQLSKHDLVGLVETSDSMTNRWCYFELTLIGDPHTPLALPAPDTSISSGPEGMVDSPLLTFTFTGSDSEDPPESLQFACRLDDGDWSSFSGEGQASFSNLAVGEHTFYVRARNSGNVEDPSPALRTFQMENWSAGPAWNSLVTGPGPGPTCPPLVRTSQAQWLAYGASGYGVNVACGNLDGSGLDEVLTGAGPGEIYGPHVRGWQPNGLALSGVNFLAYGTNRFGVNVACGDIDGDGRDEIITGAGPGAVFGPHVRGWNNDGGGTTVPIPGTSFFAYGTLKWGVNVACGDIDGDGMDEIVTGAGPGAVFGPHVRGWNHDGGGTTLPIPGVSYFAYGTLKWGVNVACGDLDNDGIDEIVTGPGPGAIFGAHVRGWNVDGGTAAPLAGASWFAYPTSHGVVVTAGDLDGDGFDEVLTAPGPDPAALAHLKGWNLDGGQVSAMAGIDFLAYDGWINCGGRVAIGNLN